MMVPPPLLLLLLLLASSVVPVGSLRQKLRIVFEPPVLVDANRSGPSMMDVSPPEFFYRLGDAAEAATKIFGPGDMPGPQRFDFSIDGGRSWADVPAQGSDLPASGIPRTYAVPNRDGSVRFASSNCCGHVVTNTSINSSSWTDTGASTFSASASVLNASWNPQAVHRWVGVPFPGMNVTATHAESGIRVYPVVLLPGGGWVAGVCIVWNGVAAHTTPDGPKPFAPLSIVAFTSADGHTWQFQSVIANYSSLPNTTFGPNEHDISVLSDGKSLVAAIRMDGDAGCSSGTYRYYYQSYSTDLGRSWTVPRPIVGAGCARPRLRLLEPDGPLLLSGGRLCVENTTGLFLWINENGLAGLHGDSPAAAAGGDGDGDGESGTGGLNPDWVRHSLSYWHNQLWQGEDYYRFTEAVNDSNAWGTLGYTSLIQTGPKSGAVLCKFCATDCCL
jgi:hypothetical protein